MPSGVYEHKRGYRLSSERIEKLRKANTGYIHTNEARERMSVAKTGKSWGKHSEETKIKIGLANSLALKGKKRPWRSGKNNPMWRGGITSKNEVFRKSMEYRLWRESVFIRDDYTCQICNNRGGEIHADHIKPFAYYPELRLSIDNGRTLCVACHRNTETYSNRFKKLEQYKLIKPKYYYEDTQLEI